MKELQPINQNILLALDDQKGMTKTQSGIILPEGAREKNAMAVVVAMSGIESPEIAVGDTVLFKEYSGNKVEFEGKEYLLIPYADILAKIVETEAI